MTTTISGDGSIELGGTSSSQGNVKLFEDTDNGTNYVELKAAANISSNVSFTLPNADGTNGQIIQTNGTGALSFTDLPSQPPTGLGTLSNTQNFTSSGTWTKPGAGDYAVVRIWGAGGGGGKGGTSNNQVGGGGGGGACVEKIYKLSDLGNTETVTIGSGGAGATLNNTAGANGGNSTFGSHLTGYGGGGGGGGPLGQAGGGGGDAGAGSQGISAAGWASGGGTTVVAKTNPGYGYFTSPPSATAVPDNSQTPTDINQPQADAFTFGLNTTAITTWSFLGGEGGGAANTGLPPSPLGGGAGGSRNSYWGGAGGATGVPTGAGQVGGTASFLGNGTNITGGTGASNANNATDGSQPACGGGGSEQGNAGAGGAGQCTVWVFTA